MQIYQANIKVGAFCFRSGEGGGVRNKNITIRGGLNRVMLFLVVWAEPELQKWWRASNSFLNSNSDPTQQAGEQQHGF